MDELDLHPEKRVLDDPLFQIALHGASDLPPRHMTLYVRLWQLERWLRRMVHVELRARYGDEWRARIRLTRAERFRAADLAMKHMPTPESDPLSYISFGELVATVQEDWSLFNVYLPPQGSWEARISEIGQIRNRIAHFRIGHPDDLRRVLQMLRDIDAGVWQFITSYTESRPILPPDELVSHFSHLDPMPWTEVEPGRWARSGTWDDAWTVGLEIEGIRRPWLSADSNHQGIDGSCGWLYLLRFTGFDQRGFNLDDFLQATQHLHSRLVHVRMNSLPAQILITLPAVLGVKRLIPMVEEFADVAKRTVAPKNYLDRWYQVEKAVADEWPEYVLSSRDPLSFLTSDMRCTIFSAGEE